MVTSMNTGDFASSSFKPGELLWHYTDFKGMEGILAGNIWASSLPYLNDMAEFRYGAEVAMEVLTRELQCASGESSQYFAELTNRVAKTLKERYKPADVFVASFSSEKDDLSQWRAYGGNGPSFSLGFDPRRLEDAAAKHLFGLHQVKYDDAHIREDVYAELQDLIEEVKASAEDESSDTARTFASFWAPNVLGRLIFLAPRYKHPKFDAEKEWRLIRRQPLLGGGPILKHHFRRSGSLVVPYVELPLHVCKPSPEGWGSELTDSALAAVVVGPSPHPEEVVFAVSEMIARMGFGNVEICRTEVPFRNW